MQVKLVPKTMDIVSCYFSPHLTNSKLLDPDPLEHAMGREKKMMIARLAGDDVCSFILLPTFNELIFSVTNPKCSIVPKSLLVSVRIWSQHISSNVLSAVCVNRMQDMSTSWYAFKVYIFWF